MNIMTPVALSVVIIFLGIIAGEIKRARENPIFVQNWPAPASFYTFVSSNGDWTTINRQNVATFHVDREKPDVFVIRMNGGAVVTIEGVTPEGIETLKKGIPGP